MDLDAVFICQGTKPRDPNLIYATGIGIDTIKPNDNRFPHATTVPLYVRASGQQGDSVANVVIRLTDADDSHTIAESLHGILFDGAPNVPASLPIFGHEVFELNLTFATPGVYASRVSVGNSREVVLPLFLRAG